MGRHSDTTPIEGRASDSGPESGQRTAPRRPSRKLSPAERAERERRRREREYVRCLLLVTQRQKEVDELVRVMESTPSPSKLTGQDIPDDPPGSHQHSVPGNRWDQWELRALRAWEDRINALNVQRALDGKLPLVVGRLPQSAYDPENAADYCASTYPSCGMDRPCHGCRTKPSD
jgi:hypothetical protein